MTNQPKTESWEERYKEFWYNQDHNYKKDEDYLRHEKQLSYQEAVEKVEKILVDGGYLNGRGIVPNIKPTHGNCCTCQACGYSHEDCVCESNNLYHQLSILKGEK